mmetsp:Transcript_30057/g.89294  ORF Transcript_30057/g.89294 Transcript_30057/m.89294 type:complete len:339 (-) Transcript_30057:1478-2494(-)
MLLNSSRVSPPSRFASAASNAKATGGGMPGANRPCIGEATVRTGAPGGAPTTTCGCGYGCARCTIAPGGGACPRGPLADGAAPAPESASSVERSCVWLSMASQTRRFSLERSSISLRIRLSKMFTVRWSESTRSLMFSWCLVRSTRSSCIISSRACVCIFARCRYSSTLPWCCSRRDRSFAMVSCKSLCCCSMSWPWRWRCWCMLSRWVSWLWSRASFSRRKRSLTCSWCRSRTSLSWASCSATRRSCVSRAFFSPLRWLCISRSYISRARFSASRASRTSSWCCARCCFSLWIMSRRSETSSASFCSSRLSRCWKLPCELESSRACLSAYSPWKPSR